MKAMAGRILGVCADKSCHIADWRELPSRDDLKQYATLDAYLHLRLHKEITRRLALGAGNGDLRQFTNGQKVKLMCRNQCCALGKMEFVGGSGGENTSWGNLSIGRGKCLASVEKVTMNSVGPVFSFKGTPENNKPSWDHTKTYLKDAFEKHKSASGCAVIAWPTNRVQVQLETILEFMRVQETDEVVVDPPTGGRAEETVAVDDTTEEEMPSYSRELEDLLEEEDDGSIPRSR